MDALSPPRSSRWAVERLTRRMHPPRPRRPLGCGPLPNKASCRNSDKNEIGCGSRCRHRAHRSSARRRAAPALWDTSHRNGKPCQCAAGTPCSGTGKPAPVHLWQLLEESRSGIARFVPLAPPRLSRAFLILFPREELHHLLDVGTHQVNAEHLAGVSPHPEDDICPANPIDDEETSVVASNREPSDAILHRSSALHPFDGYNIYGVPP